MRLVHLSDLHLGFRQYQRLTPGGINQREADVAATFRRAIDQVIQLQPQLVVFGGDIFHTVRPSNPAILHAFNQLSRLMQALPDAAVVMVAGNHDLPRAAETGCILRLFQPLGIHVADMEARRFHFPDRDLSVLAVPDIPVRPELTPDPAATWNVLLLHGEVEGMLPDHLATAERAALEISKAELAAQRWSYVALGHYHVHRQVAPNAYYAGSIDYTSANPWGELYEERVSGLPGKGIVEHDLRTGEHRLVPLQGNRILMDLDPISAAGLTVAELDSAIAAAIDRCPGGIDDKVVRLVVRDVPRHVVRDLDHKALRDAKRRALHFHLDTRRPEVARTFGQASPGKRPSLADVVRQKLTTRVIDADVSRDALVSLGLHYLDESERQLHAAPIGGAAAPTDA